MCFKIYKGMDGLMDGWMDGVDLIICVAIWTLYKGRLPLTCGELLAVCIASLNKLRSASLFGAISKDFETFREAKIEAKIDFSEVFFDVFSECDFASILGQFFEARNPKNSNFP